MRKKEGFFIVFVVSLIGLLFNFSLFTESFSKVSFVDSQKYIWKNYVRDPNFEGDLAWDFSSNQPSDTQGSWEYDYNTFTKGSRSVKLTFSKNLSSGIAFQSSIRPKSFFAFYDSRPPIGVMIKFDMKCTYNGTDPYNILPFVQLVQPPDNPPQLQYFSRAQVSYPFHEEWTSYNQNLTDYSYISQIFQKNTVVKVEFGIEWVFRSPPVLNGTAIAWFDDIQIIIPQKTSEIDVFPKMQWNHSYGGAGYALVQTTDGGFALAGSTRPSGSWDADMWLVKTGPNGLPQWNHSYGRTGSDVAHTAVQTTDGGIAWAGSDVAHALVQTTDEGFALAGLTHTNVNKADFWLVKTDANGQAEWNQTFGGIYQDWVYSLIQTTDGGFALAGSTYYSVYENYHYVSKQDILLVKTNASGEAEWNNTYGGIGFNKAFSLVQTTDGGFAIAGSTQLSDGWDVDMLLVKTDASGQAEWNNTYTGTEYEAATSLIQTADGGFALAGSTGPLYNQDMWLVKTDTNGIAQFNRTFGGIGWDSAKALLQTDDDGFVIVGMYDEGHELFNSGRLRDMWLVKTDANGFAQWNQTYGGIHDEQAFALVQTDDGGFALLGSSESEGMWLVKIESISTKTNGLIDGLILIVSLAMLVFSLTIGGNQYVTRRKRQKDRMKGEEALQRDDFMGAIRFFYEANDSEKLIEVIKMIILNPDLTSQSQQILQMDEIQDYVKLAYDVINKPDLTDPLGHF